jgi:flagellar basal body rod protein FlgG
VAAGEVRTDPRSRRQDAGMPMSFPTANTGINFVMGETQATRRELDVAIQGDGYFEVQLEDGSKAYTRSGEFRLRADRTLVTSSGKEVMSEGGGPITFVAGGDPVTINRDGTLFQGENSLGKLSVQKFENNADLVPIAGGFFVPGATSTPERVEAPELMQGYLEGSNISALREMVDLVLISRAYEANQKIIKTVDEQMDKTLNALG